MHRGSTTIFKNYGGFEVELRRRVKQRGPLSSILSNVVLDPLLDRLEGQGGGLRVGDHSISVLAFADDLVLLACDPVAAQPNLKRKRGGVMPIVNTSTLL